MIFDSHCPRLAKLPYDPAVPDRDTRGSIEQLAFEMDSNGVDKALIVCAEIKGNPDNNQYVYEKSQTYGDRFAYVVDVDSRWKDSYHSDGAAERLERAVKRWNPLVSRTICWTTPMKEPGYIPKLASPSLTSH